MEDRVYINDTYERQFEREQPLIRPYLPPLSPFLYDEPLTNETLEDLEEISSNELDDGDNENGRMPRKQVQ